MQSTPAWSHFSLHPGPFRGRRALVLCARWRRSMGQGCWHGAVAVVALEPLLLAQFGMG